MTTGHPGPPFEVGKSAAGRIIDDSEPMLALQRRTRFGAALRGRRLKGDGVRHAVLGTLGARIE